MTEKIVPAHGSSVARADIPADCKWRVSDIYIDETAWKEACASARPPSIGGRSPPGHALYALPSGSLPLSFSATDCCCSISTIPRSCRIP